MNAPSSTSRVYRVWIYGIIAVILIAGGIWWISRPAPHFRAAPKKSSAVLPQVIGFYKNSGTGSTQAYTAHAAQMSTLSPVWFSAEPTGTIQSHGVEASLVRAAHAHQVKVVPLVTNAQGSSQVLMDAATRARAVDQLMQLVKQDNLDGINVDFEMLNAASRPDLSDFIAQLGDALHQDHKVLGVSVFPLVGVPYSVNGAYDYHDLARSANYLVIMAYDQHYSGGTAGPVAPYNWVQQNVQAALKDAPADRLVLGVGLYGYDWVDNNQPGPAPTIPDNQAAALAQKYGATIHYLPKISQNYFVYHTANGVKHIVYYMGNRSAAQRIALAQKNHLAGIAIWRLGYEKPGFWQLLPATQFQHGR
ncbi:MAG: glycosyl hydrolase family 18 protein [Firmicutes bacterium]|nr:glycosyl hydrolase family 18 protein [Bacillota bacterium]